MTNHVVPPIGYFLLNTPTFTIVVKSVQDRISVHVCDGVAPIIASALRVEPDTYLLEDVDGRAYWEERKGLGLGTLAINVLLAFMQANAFFSAVAIKGEVHHPDGSTPDQKAKRQRFFESFGFDVNARYQFKTPLGQLAQVAERSNPRSLAQKLLWSRFASLPGEPRQLLCGAMQWLIG